MKTIHYASGLVLASFVSIHILNHLLILRSERLHVRFMEVTRNIYRTPIVESLLLLSVITQVISGTILAIRKLADANHLFEWINILSGLYLAIFFVIHITAVMVGRYKLQLNTNLYYGAGVMNTWPQKIFFIPYYAFALVSFFFHIACIHRTKMRDYVPASVADFQSYCIMGLGIFITIVIIFKMSNLKTIRIERMIEKRQDIFQNELVNDQKKKE